MESLIKLVPSFEIRVGENDTVVLNAWELTALQLWLVMANGCREAKPLWLKGKKFVSCENELIFFEDVYCTLNRGRIIDLINAISALTLEEVTAIHLLCVHYPNASSWQGRVQLNETMSGSYIGYWSEETGESFLPVKLRWSEDLDAWYGVKGDHNYGVSFKFKDLSIWQI